MALAHRFAWFVLASTLTTGCAGCEDSAALAGGDAAPGDGGNVPYDGGDPAAACPAPEQASALLTKAATAIEATRARRRTVQEAVFGGLEGIDWDPSHDSISFELLDVEQNVPLLVSNAAGSPPSKGVVLGLAGERKGARYAMLANDPLSDLTQKPPAAGSAAAKMDAFDERLVKWLLGRDPGDGAGLKIVLAHLAETYWFPHDTHTPKFFASKLPGATVSAEDACESGALAGCLAGASLLVLSGEDGSADDDHKTAADDDAVLAALDALDAAEAAKVPVLFVGFGSKPSKLAERILARYGVRGATNYWAKEKLVAFSPSTLAKTADALDAYGRALSTLTLGSLTAADYETCTKAWAECSAAGFQSKLGDGAARLRSALAGLDAGGQDLAKLEGYDLLRTLASLGDAYRAEAIAYPVDPKKDPAAFARAVFADSSVHYATACNRKQRDLGTYVCERKDLLAGACKPYDVAAVARIEGVIDEPFRAGSEWTSTGFYALPGVAFTLTREDGVDAPLSVQLNFQRVSSTRSLEWDGKGVANYDRPQYLASAPLVLTKGRTVVASSPYGGPVYVRLEGTADVAAQRARVRIANVARHPALLDLGDPAVVKAFVDSVRDNPLPHVDLRGAGFEAHLRKDRFLATVTEPYDIADRGDGSAVKVDYAGDVGRLLADVRDHWIGPEYALAGFAAPGKTLEATLGEDVKKICKSLGWDCLDPTLHSRTQTQHANYDQYAACGSGCSGNPFDASWAISPLGWGESHELGHNLQVGPLQIGYVPEGKRNDWSQYASRAGENSNNIFPYHNLWRYLRTVAKEGGRVDDGHMRLKELFAMIQSSRAGLTRTIGGASRKVVFDDKCKVVGDFDPAATDVHSEAIWSSDAYAATNGPRMGFYLQLAFRLHGAAMSDGTTLRDGFDVFTLLYQASRLFRSAAGDDAKWTAAREGLGFGLFPREGHATYGGRKVAEIPGNDFILVALARIAGKDFRRYFRDHGVRFTDLASSQVDALATSGVVKGTVGAVLSVLDADLPPADLSTLSTVAIDGTAKWPRDGFHPSSCP